MNTYILKTKLLFIDFLIIHHGTRHGSTANLLEAAGLTF